MAYLRLNRYQIELVKSARIDGRPRTVVLHRFKSPEGIEALRQTQVRARLEKKAGEKLDVAALLKRADVLRTGQAAEDKRQDVRSLHTTTRKGPPAPAWIRALPLDLPAGLERPKAWEDYASWRGLLDAQAYAQACVAVFEFELLYRFEVRPAIYRGEPMLRVSGAEAGPKGVIFPIPALLSILRHGAAIMRVMFEPARGAIERFWEDAGVSCKTFSGEWLSVSELSEIEKARSSLKEFGVGLTSMKEWLRSHPSVGAVQKALSQVVRGRMRRETMRRRLLGEGAPEFGQATWLIWEKAIYGLGPRRR